MTGSVPERRVRLLPSGRVQGVWFRESTRRRADELGLAGWVRNLPDGRVEAIAQGDAAAVALLIEFVRVGPPQAQVRELAIEELVPEASPESGFRVR